MNKQLDESERNLLQIFIQIGAGAGDRDARANFRDGFTEFVKSIPPKSTQRIILVEPNPRNVVALKRCWKDYPQAEIKQIGIVPDENTSSLEFYYAEDDQPHFQVCSTDKSHVEKHYPDSKLIQFTAECKGINSFLGEVLDDRTSCFLALDVEGLDFYAVGGVVRLEWFFE